MYEIFVSRTVLDTGMCSPLTRWSLTLTRAFDLLVPSKLGAGNPMSSFDKCYCGAITFRSNISSNQWALGRVIYPVGFAGLRFYTTNGRFRGTQAPGSRSESTMDTDIITLV